MSQRGNPISSEGSDWDASKITVHDTTLANLASGSFITDLASGHSSPTDVPEIGAHGAMAALMLVLGSVAVMGGRRRRFEA